MEKLSMTERKLVTLRIVDDLKPIEGADLIELAIIDGWQVVVKKGSFKVGDIAVYHEIDSFCPIHPRYEFLRKNCYRNVNGLGEGFRIKPIKLKGERSQGLLLPLSDFDIYKESESVWKYTDSTGNHYYIDPNADQDLSEIFGVIKYDLPLAANLQGKAKGNFPSDIRKTDQERVQNLKKYFNKDILGHVFEVSLKLDGTSMTVYKRSEDDFGVCSRNLNLKLDDNEGNKYVSFCLTNNLFRYIPSGYALQFELMGPGIQGNRENLKEDCAYLFDIQDINEQRYLTPAERVEFYNKHLTLAPNIKHIPILREGLMEIPPDFTVDKFLEISNNQKSLNHPIAEGIVYKRIDGIFSFKVVSDRFLFESEA